MTQSIPRYWCVLPAAGMGLRMQHGIPKAYLPFLGKTIIEHTLARLLAVPQLEKIIVVISHQDTFAHSLTIMEHPKIEIALGGSARCHSVLNGLDLLSRYADERDWVLVHDVARPCVSLKDIEKLMRACADHPVGGLLACPMVETIKQTNAAMQVIRTLDRTCLWRAQTPQCFRFGLLHRAMQQAIEQNQLVTDESSAIELLGDEPFILEGTNENIKITYPEDLLLAENILARQAA